MRHSLLIWLTISVFSCGGPQQDTSQMQASSQKPQKIRLIENDPKIQNTLNLINKQDLRQRVQALGLSESDPITLKISPEGKILQLYATEIKIAGALSEAMAVGGGVMLAPGYFLLGTGDLSSGVGVLLIGTSMILLGAKLH